MNRIAHQKHQLAELPGLSRGCRRLVSHLATGRWVRTGELASACSIGNISDAVLRANVHLRPTGWRIVSRLPKPLSTNKFGEASSQHEWALQRVR